MRADTVCFDLGEIPEPQRVATRVRAQGPLDEAAAWGDGELGVDGGAGHSGRDVPHWTVRLEMVGWQISCYVATTHNNVRHPRWLEAVLRGRERGVRGQSWLWTGTKGSNLLGNLRGRDFHFFQVLKTNDQQIESFSRKQPEELFTPSTL